MHSHAATTRRTILKQTAASLGALAFPTIIPASALGQGGRPAPSGRVSLAVIGTGGRGTDVMKSFLQDERVQVVAVCDVERESDRYNKGIVKKGGTLGREPARRLVDETHGTKGCAVHEDFREVLARTDVDAVLIATPDHWHAIQAIAAARAKKHIYCEKPVSLTIEQGRVMSDAVRASGVVWQTGSQQRSEVHFRMACEYVRSGRIGKLKAIKVGLASGNRDNNGSAALTAPAPVPPGLNYELWLGPAPEAAFCPARLHSNWRWFYDYSGGNITDFGAHHLDIVQWALDSDAGGPVEFTNFKAQWPAKGSLYNTPETFSFEFAYADGTRVFVADQMDDFKSGIRFEGESGTITCARGMLKIEPEELRKPLAKDDVRLPVSQHHQRNFVDAILTGSTTIAPVETAHRSITVAHLANIGLRLGCEKLRWDPAKETVLGNDEAQAMLTRPMRGEWRLAA
jgi:predicted dehydrogenase